MLETLHYSNSGGYTNGTFTNIKNSVQYIRDYETNTKELHSDIDTVGAELNELKDKYKHLVINNKLDEADKLHNNLVAKGTSTIKVRPFCYYARYNP